MPQDKLLHHEADGIKEYDNDLPKWWVWLFILTVVWSVVYIYWFHLSGRPTPVEAIQAEMKAHYAKTGEDQPPSKDAQDPSDLAAFIGDKDQIKAGAEIFSSKCATCHGHHGEGLIGPNLTDKHWIHGGAPSEIRKVIQDGVLAKGMLAWKTMLKKEEINQATAFVVSLKGSNPPNPKAPEGDPEK